MKNKMKLSLIAIAGLVGTTAVLSSCDHGGKNPGKVDDTYVAYDVAKYGAPEKLGTKGEKIKIQWVDSFGGNSETATQMKSLINNFHKKYPGIEVTRVDKGGYQAVYDAMLKDIPAGRTPQIAICYPDHVGSYIGSNTVIKLDGFMNDPVIGFGKGEKESVTDIFSSYLKEGQVYSRPGTYSLPFSKSTEVMFYNNDLLKGSKIEVPQTWNDLWEAAEKLKAASKDPSFVPVGYDSDDNLFITLCEQYGIKYTAKNNPHYLFDNPEAKKMVKDIQDKIDRGLLTTKGISKNNEFTSNMFTEGKICFAIGSTGGTNYNYAEKIDIGVASVPQKDTENRRVISQGPSVCMFNTATLEQKYASFLFYKFITSSDASANLATKTGYNPVRKSSYKSEIWTNWQENGGDEGKVGLIKKTTTFVKEQYKESDYFVSPVFKGSANARSQVGKIFAKVNAEAGKNVTEGKISVDEAIEKAFDTAMKECALIKD